jgi:hypothetical protein
MTPEVVTKKDRIIPAHSEEYEVLFEIIDENGFWTQKKITYYGTAKGQHEQVEALWEQEHRDHTVELISISCN